LEAASMTQDEDITHAVEKLLILANVPSSNREPAHQNIAGILHEWSVTYLEQKSHKPSREFLKFERALRSAYVAYGKLDDEERKFLNDSAYVVYRKLDDEEQKFLNDGRPNWALDLIEMIFVCTWITGKSPLVSPGDGRGRRKGDIKNFPLKSFVHVLAFYLSKNGGRLTLDVKGRRGTWIRALELLRPVMTAGFIPKALPLSTIDDWIREFDSLPKNLFF
jgi:hypothetical protein